MFPALAIVVDEDAPVIVVVPDLVVEKVYCGVSSVVGVVTGVTSVIWGAIASTVNDVTVNILDSFPLLSVTLIVTLS